MPVLLSPLALQAAACHNSIFPSITRLNPHLSDSSHGFGYKTAMVKCCRAIAGIVRALALAA